MQNWSSDENEAMKGYIILATKYMNGDYRTEYGKNAIDDEKLQTLFYYLRRACDDLTAAEARQYFLKSDFS